MAREAAGRRDAEPKPFDVGEWLADSGLSGDSPLDFFLAWKDHRLHMSRTWRARFWPPQFDEWIEFGAPPRGSAAAEIWPE